ncbi:antileukoproteinase-like isoform X2 [Dendrobates tinctorius]|uniref:antileukoproteinase-like isoform X2 n=1 Tax=Dendrobates tinctorius TaxID=92724 RepID=UPI003CC93146
MAPVKISFLLLLFLCCSDYPTSAVSPPKPSGDNGKPGHCPIPTAWCLILSPGECETDKDCGGNKKCCTVGCAPECTEPGKRIITDRDGSCEPDSPEIHCKTLDDTLCARDYQCPEPMKCCKKGCKLECRHPIF